MDQTEEVVTLDLLASPDKVRADAHDYLLITKAIDEFDRCNYDACIDFLEQLESLKDQDIKLHHNKAVAKFYKDNCKEYMTLLEQLQKLDTKEFLSEKDINVSSLPFTIYNKAVIYYHRHMHNAALDILEPLFYKMDSYDENVLTMLGILEMRLLLASNQPEKALFFLEVFLKKLGINILHLITDDLNSHESIPRLDENVSKSLKLMALITQVVNKKLVVVPEDVSPAFSALKAHQYYIMKDFQMAAKQLNKINVSRYMNGLYNQELNTLIANNMGVIHLRVRHYAIAANFFQKAISFDKHIAVNLRNIPLHHMSSAKSCEILYNLGIAMLHLRRPTEAFQCFLVPLKTYHSNPRLWIRIAEACIMEHEIRSFDEKRLASNGARTFFSNRISYMENSQSSAVLEPTMGFAALSLRNALTLTQFYLKQFNTSQTNEDFMNNTPQSQNWRTPKDNNFCPPSRPISKQTFCILLSSIYAAYSYVSLRLGDYVTGLEMAEELLKTESLSDAHKMLAHMYAGEALIMMDKLPDARSHLEPTYVSNLNIFDFETKDWQVKSVDAAQNIVRYNLAVAMFLQGDVEMSRSLLNTCTHPIVSQKVSLFKKMQATMATASATSNIYFAPRI
ncbi:CCR4-NOT transcription complex subunit 10 isoform X2 [Calliphora vicina]|uniref:CCR4-NOT transcription complex subunit 10 isoform X2 n=1 Tax=Calliphora vicina TaxID=7373 RepID=UPI00325BC129